MFHTILALALGVGAGSVAASSQLKFSQSDLEVIWKNRIQLLLDNGELPKIDMETSFRRSQVDEHIPAVFKMMDKLGIALISADGYQARKGEKAKTKGYRWSHYIIDLVNRYPERFVPTTNGGTNRNWLLQKGGRKKHFIDQLEKRVYDGDYMNIGEIDFRHYMSSRQCKNRRFARDTNIPLTSRNGHRLFRLSTQTGVPFSIHLEPEQDQLDQLEKMLSVYPLAKVIVAHFGQVRHPEVQHGFTAKRVRALFAKYQNLNYDLATGYPNRTYNCAGPFNNEKLEGDTILWQGGRGNQTDTIRSEWRSVFTDFSDRFVFASDHGGGRPPLPQFLRNKIELFNLIIRDIPDHAKHNIAYRNAWKLLTGKVWK
jgi:predicted TIM-barrel fold metal-dependent hydrolase